MTLHQLLTEGTEQLKNAGNPEAQLDARRLLLEAFQIDMVHFFMVRMQQLPQNVTVQRALNDYRDMIKKRCQRKPIQHILGSQEFMGLTFWVNSHVLIPRQDTETLVEQVLMEQALSKETTREKKVLDLCTGSGCIAISLMEKGRFSHMVATDLSWEALLVAQENAKRLLTGQGEDGKELIFCQGDLFKALESGMKFDILVSNPPYVPTDIIKELQPEVRDHEPVMALDGAKDGLEFYRRIASEAREWLQAGASVYLEIGYDQGREVCELLEKQGFQNIKIVKDLSGLDRVVRADYLSVEIGKEESYV